MARTGGPVYLPFYSDLSTPGSGAQAVLPAVDSSVVERESLPPEPESPELDTSGFWAGAPISTPEERRRRRRRPCRVPGWIYRADQVWKVHMRNISGDGAGFVCDVALSKAERLHLKAGLGPTRRPRLAEVVFVRQRADGRSDVGVRFVRH